MIAREAAEIAVVLASAYAVTGLAVGLAFLLFSIERFDRGAAGSYAVRPLLLPGLALLWPYVLFWWAHGPRTAAPGGQGGQRAHRRAWLLLALLLPAILLAAAVARPWGEGASPILLRAPGATQ